MCFVIIIDFCCFRAMTRPAVDLTLGCKLKSFYHKYLLFYCKNFYFESPCSRVWVINYVRPKVQTFWPNLHHHEKFCQNSTYDTSLFAICKMAAVHNLGFSNF